MKRGLLILALLTLVVSVACDDRDRPGVERPAETVAEEGCDSPQSDLEKEPNYSADYLHRWETDKGCPIRLDILMTRQGKNACGGDRAADILMGTPLGKPHEDSKPRIYVKDPTNVFDDKETSSAYAPDATLPDGARDSGYRQNGVELWIDSRDAHFIYLVHGDDDVERWPLDWSPPVCA